MRLTLILSAIFLFALTACQSDKKEAATSATTAPTKPAAPADKYVLTPFSSSPQYPTAKIDAMTYKNGKFDFDISGEYELGAQTSDAPGKMCANSGKGQHIHLIVGTAPYAAKYVANFEHDVADGDHSLLAFLSRSYHESIKSSGASTAVNVTVKDKSITDATPIEAPTLFYSRPKGTYIGKANTDKVMLDFFLANVDLKGGYTVKADINGEDHTITRWQPYYIEGLPMGENKITLTLLKNGKVVESPINPVTRTFTLKADPVEG